MWPYDDALAKVSCATSGKGFSRKRNTPLSCPRHFSDDWNVTAASWTVMLKHEAKHCGWIDQPLPILSSWAHLVPLQYLDDLVEGRAQVPVLDFIDSFTKASLSSHILATVSSDSQHFTYSNLHNKEEGKRITCFPGLRLLILPQTWYLKEKQSFLPILKCLYEALTQNKYVMKNDESTQFWQWNGVLCT